MDRLRLRLFPGREHSIGPEVSLLNRPIKSPTPFPFELVLISPWYQERPKGLLGSWITKKSKSLFAGSPITSTCMNSIGPSETLLTSDFLLLSSGQSPNEHNRGL
jgi:hypothetical protein